MRSHLSVIAAALLALSCSRPLISAEGDPKLLFPGEKHLANIRQLTRGGTNAEAYWSFDGKRLAYQHKPGRGQGLCDQIFTMKADGSDVTPISKNRGRTTCAYYLPDNKQVLFSSTLSDGNECPADPDMSRGYVWPIFPSYQIYVTRPDGSDLRPLEPGAPRAYNAEATVCKDGSVIFTSDRDGDLDLYVGKLDSLGTMGNIRRVTTLLGYDGGAFFSQDCSKIVWRASRPRPGKEADEYKALLKQHLVRPSQLEIWVANADGSHAHQVTRVGAASFAPYFTPDAKRIIFASNPRNPRGRSFDLYLINTNGTGLERVSFSNTFESFPMFSPDGKYLAFSSNRNATEPHETNVFVADWIETPWVIPTADDADAANRAYAIATAATDAPPLYRTLGGACARKPAIHLEGTTKTGTAGVIEASRVIEKADAKLLARSCFVFTSPGATLAPHIKVKATLRLAEIGYMENNTLSFSGAAAPLKAACVARQLVCAPAAGTAAKGPLELSTGKYAAAELNATGIVQTAELAADIALALAGKR